MSEVALEGRKGFFASFQYVTLIGGQTTGIAGRCDFAAGSDDAELPGMAYSLCAGRRAGGCGVILRRQLDENPEA